MDIICINRDPGYVYRVYFGRRALYGWICTLGASPDGKDVTYRVILISNVDEPETRAPTFRQLFAQLERLSVTYTSPNRWGLASRTMC